VTPQRIIKDSLYGQLARLTKSVAHPKRLELIDLLCQSPKSVEQLAEQSGVGMTLASAHLKELRQAHIVDAQKQGRHVIYRLACPQTASLLVMLRSIAADCLLELQDALDKVNGSAEPWVQTDGPTLLRKAKRGEVTVLDVRPAQEFEARHLPHARNIPIAELAKRLREVPKSKPVIAYCRGPYCLWSAEAVTLLKASGYRAYSWPEGGANWIANDAEAAREKTASGS
jgi:rhodanese-related sulfurtransferase